VAKGTLMVGTDQPFSGRCCKIKNF